MNDIKSKRHEIKYLISYHDYIVLESKLSHILRPDIHCEKEPYKVTSLYYDDIDSSAYRDKIEGFSFRSKYRIRYYDSDLTSFKLERKSKSHQITSKNGVALTRENVEDILNKNYDCLKDSTSEVGNSFYRKIINGLFRPKVVVEYYRKAFTHPVGNLRITFDTDVKASFTNTNIFDKNLILLNAIPRDKVVMEIKFNGELPIYIRSLLQTRNVMAASLSKYVVSRQLNYYL